jgi:hypothetical protein
MLAGRCAVIGLAVSLVVLAGCGSSRPKTISVSGTVTYKKSPLKGANVIFAPRDRTLGRTAYGTTDGNGMYQLWTFKPDDGAVPADYNVAIICKTTDKGKTKSAIPENYASPDKSGLKATVASGQQEHRFDLQ